MGFYHGSNQPPDEPEPGSWKEIFQIILIVFRVIALPLGLLLAAVLGLFALFYLFMLHVLAGLGLILALVAAVVARGIWEARHPPELR